MTDPKKYKSNDKDAQGLPVSRPLYDDIKAGKAEFLLEVLNARKNILQTELRKGTDQKSFTRWSACVTALEAACKLINKIKGEHHG